jgi:hypothetical protein
MNWPPMLLHLRFPNDSGGWGLWLPLFLIYPILLALSLVALPFLLLAALCMLPAGKAKIPVLVLPYAWNVIFKTRGLMVDVRNENGDVLVNFI